MLQTRLIDVESLTNIKGCSKLNVWQHEHGISEQAVTTCMKCVRQISQKVQIVLCLHDSRPTRNVVRALGKSRKYPRCASIAACGRCLVAQRSQKELQHHLRRQTLAADVSQRAPPACS